MFARGADHVDDVIDQRVGQTHLSDAIADHCERLAVGDGRQAEILELRHG
jgi:hypothetical protein